MSSSLDDYIKTGLLWFTGNQVHFQSCIDIPNEIVRHMDHKPEGCTCDTYSAPWSEQYLATRIQRTWASRVCHDVNISYIELHLSRTLQDDTLNRMCVRITKCVQCPSMVQAGRCKIQYLGAFNSQHLYLMTNIPDSPILEEYGLAKSQVYNNTHVLYILHV